SRRSPRSGRCPTPLIRMGSPRWRTLRSSTPPERLPSPSTAPPQLNGVPMTMTSNATRRNHDTAAVLALLTGLLAAASTPVRSADAAAAPETIVLKAAHVFDSTGTSLKDGATVVVRGD